MPPSIETIITLLEDGDIFYDLIVTLINNNPDLLNQLNDKDSKGNTVLLYAVKHVAIESLKFLLSQENIDIYARNQDNKTPMQCIPDSASLKQREEIIALLHQYEVRLLWKKVKFHQSQAQEVKKEFEDFTEQYEGYINQLSTLYTKLEKEKKELEEKVQESQHTSRSKSEITGLEEQLATTQYLLNRDNSKRADSDDEDIHDEKTKSNEIVHSLVDRSGENQSDETVKELCRLGCLHGKTKFKQSAWKRAFETNNQQLIIYLAVYSGSLLSTELEELNKHIKENEKQFSIAKDILQQFLEKSDNADRIKHISNNPIIIFIIQQAYERSKSNISSSLLNDDLIRLNIYSALRNFFENSTSKRNLPTQNIRELFDSLDIVPLTVRIDFLESLLSKDEIKPEDFYIILDTLITTLLQKDNLVHLQRGTLRIRIQKLRTALIEKFAELISINDQVAFKNIPQAEFETTKKGRNLLAWISYFNELSLVVIAQISDTKSIDKSTLLTEFYIHLAAKLRDKHNFQSMMAIIVAINNNSVYRLKAVKAGLSDSAKRLFEELEELVSVSGNSRNMRNTIAILNKQQALLVPSIGTYCGDLTFANDADNQKKVTEIAEGLASMQSRLPPASRAQSRKAISFAEHIKQSYSNIYGESFNDKDDYCYHQSLNLEPRKSQLSPSNLLSHDQLGNILDPTVIDGQMLASFLLSTFRRSSTITQTEVPTENQPKLQRFKTEVSPGQQGKKLSNDNRSVTASLNAFTKP